MVYIPAHLRPKRRPASFTFLLDNLSPSTAVSCSSESDTKHRKIDEHVALNVDL